MINVFTIHPMLFDISALNEEEKDYLIKQILIFKKFCLTEADIVCVDKKQVIQNEIGKNILKESNLDRRKKLETLYKQLFARCIYSKLSDRTLLFPQKCANILSLVLKSQPEAVLTNSFSCGMEACEECFTKIVNGIRVQNIMDIQNWEKTKTIFTGLPNEYNFESLIESFNIKKLLRNSKKFVLYDKNIIPETSDGIPVEYIYNLRLFLNLFKGYDYHPIIITYASHNQSSDVLRTAVNQIKELSRELRLKIDFKILSHRNIHSTYAEQIHNRYVFTDLVNFSTDRGLNFINMTSNQCRSFQINIIPVDEAIKFEKYLLDLSEKIID